MNILTLTENKEVVAIVRSAADLLRQRKTAESAALTIMLDHAADQMMDDLVFEVFDAERVRDKMYVTEGSIIRKYGDNSLYTATLTLARLVVLAGA